MDYLELATAAHHGGSVRELTLPGGPLSARAARELAACCDDLVEDRSVRVVVLVATADDFCTGRGPDLDPVVLGVDPAATLARLRPPVVAVVRGACHSVGVELVLAADIRVASPDAYFVFDDLAAGRLPCWGGTQRLPRAVGASRAAPMLLLGQSLDAADAEAAGLVHRVAADTAHATGEIVDQLLSVGPLALELAKEAVHRGAELPLRDGLRLEGDLNHLLASSEDRAEGLAAFFAKRPPDFAGR